MKMRGSAGVWRVWALAILGPSGLVAGCTRDPAPPAASGAGAPGELVSSEAGAATPEPSDTEGAILVRGRAAFDQGRCAKCHGEDGSGNERGPDLTDGDWLHIDGSVGAIRGLLDSGVPRERLVDPARPFPMNPATRLVPDAGDLDALAAYVRSLSA